MTMIRRVGWIGGWLLLLLPVVANAEAVAMVSDLQGAAVRVEAGGEMPLQLLDYLHPGARVKVTEGEATLVFFDSGREYRVGAGSEVSIVASGPWADDGVLEGRSLQLAEKVDFAALSGDGAGQGVTQGALTFRGRHTPSRLSLTEPKGGRLLERGPRFLWKGLGEGARYRFTLFDGLGRLLYEEWTAAGELSLPLELQEGDYGWSVEATLANGERYTASARFGVVGGAERAEIEGLRPAVDAPFSQRLLYAAYLESRGYGQAAREAWRSLAAERPGDAALRERAR